MATRYSYTGDTVLTYPAYFDTEAGTTLTATPGGSYEIAAADPDGIVPPPDGRWKSSTKREPKGGEGQ